jgi:protein-L-isoaspartate(D-aspartate) O-methyltransferase
VPRVSGVGLTSGRAQQAMVDALRTFGIRNEAVLAAMREVPRHNFIEAGLVSRAYDDVALPIGFEQTISKPSTVSRMIELGISDPSKNQPPKALKNYKVLEVGTYSWLARVSPQQFTSPAFKPPPIGVRRWPAWRA